MSMSRRQFVMTTATALAIPGIAFAQERVNYRITNRASKLVYFILRGSGKKYSLNAGSSETYTNPGPPVIEVFQPDGNTQTWKTPTSGNYEIYELSSGAFGFRAV